MLNAQSVSHLLALLLSALVAGLLYGYACSVNPGLGRLPDEAYLRAMQSVNSAIQNPAFFASFMGTLIVLPVCAWLSYRQGGTSFQTGTLLAATLLYAIGVFGVTMAGNVPLNNMLAGLKIDSASLSELRQTRLKFEGPWNSFHGVRTVCAILAFLFAALPLVKK